MKKLALISLLSGLSAGYSLSTYAACTPNQAFSTIDIAMNVGRVVVRPTDAVGTVLKKATFPITANSSTYTCDFSAGSIIAQLSQNYPKSNIGDSVYTTNIPGIGIRLYREADNAADFSGYYPYQKQLNRNTSYRLASGYFAVEIIKTDLQIGSGALMPGRYSSYHSSSHPNRPFLTSTVYGNAITIASSSCAIQGANNQTITLPTVTTSQFTGVGSIQAAQPFSFDILCNGGKNNTSFQEKNSISLKFGFTPDPTGNDVIINSAPDSTKARGIGLQIISDYQNTNQAITNGGHVQLGTVSSNDSVQYHVPLHARYYQTEDTVKAGQVRAIATITIDYQ